MNLTFDPAKDASNIAKHGVSLARALELDVQIQFSDGRFEEPRYRAFGLLDGEIYCLAFTVRGEAIRAISLRRAHRKEYRRHVP